VNPAIDEIPITQNQKKKITYCWLTTIVSLLSALAVVMTSLPLSLCVSSLLAVVVAVVVNLCCRCAAVVLRRRAAAAVLPS
jgi:hypothetical protein